MLFSRNERILSLLLTPVYGKMGLGVVEMEQNHGQLLWGPQTLDTVVTPLN